MPWARLDDSMLNHPKLIGCTPAARWLFVATILYCRQNHTGGELSRGQMSSHLRAQGCAKKHLVELLEVGLIIDMDYSYEVHDYSEFNPLTSTERVRKHRSQKQTGNADETFHGVSETPPHTRAGAPGLVPQPVPQPDDLAVIPPDSPPLALVVNRTAGLAGALEDLLRRPLTAKERHVVMGWSALERGGDSVPVAEVLECCRRVLAQPTKDGTLPGGLSFCNDSVLALARAPLPSGRVSAPSKRAGDIDAFVAELGGLS